MKKILVFGNNFIAKILYQEAEKRSLDFEIIAFTVDEKYMDSSEFCGKPLVPFEEVAKLYPPQEYDMFSTVDAPTCMHNRIKVFKRIQQAGYYMPNYISPLADVADDIELGQNNLILAFSHVGSGGKLGNANFVMQNTYLAHDFSIGNGCMIAGGATIAGCCNIGNSCFIGVGSTIVDHVTIADDTLVGAGSVVIRSTLQGTTVVGNPAKIIGSHNETGIMMNTSKR